LIAYVVRSNGWRARDLLIQDCLSPHPRRTPQERLMPLIAGIANTNPDLTFLDIARQLVAMHE
jgi:hypothetical protein